MSVTCFECKDSELKSMLSNITQSVSQPMMIYNLSTLHLKYGGRLSDCLAVLIAKISSVSNHAFIISAPDTWMTPLKTYDDSLLSAGATSESDESDMESSGNIGLSSGWVDTLFAVVNYFKIFNRGNKLIVIFNGSVPKKLRPIFPVPESISAVSESLILDSQTFFMSSTTCICVRGEGKTRRLRSISTPAVWIYPHELISCELGQSVSIVHQYFAKAAKLGGTVVFDDADLTLNTSGRIIREIIDEIGICLTEFRGKVFFVFSISVPIDISIMKRIDHTIE